MRSIMVPVDGSHASLQAVALACDIARKNKGSVSVVHVIEVKRTMPLDAELEGEAAAGEEILTQAARVAREQDFDVDSEILQAREASHAIVDEAIERGADLIILGMEYKQPFGEFQLGRVIQYVMRSAPCEVWVCRHPVKE
ncbi:MAG: universal stress protein [Chloroflexi bacterium]|nr:universal stress protein [Chloroflexota bacterium]